MKTWGQLLKEGTTMLEKVDIENASYDAQSLLMHLLQSSTANFLLIKNQEVNENIQKKFIDLILKRAKNVPLQYLLEEWAFYGHTFKVGPGVLIPRTETESLVDFALQEGKKKTNPIIFDLCSGSGCIAISISLALPNAQIYAVEKSPLALHYLMQNKANHNANIHVIEGDITQGFRHFSLPKPDIIISNPPYIPYNDLSNLQSEVLYEPTEALDGGEDGLEFYRCLANDWFPYLNVNGATMVEHGEGQAQEIKKLLTLSGMKKVKIVKDMYQVERYVQAYI